VTLFVAICALFLAAAIGLVVWPLIGPRRRGDAIAKAPAAAFVVAATLPVAAFLLYFWASNWDWNPPPQQPPPPGMGMSAAEIQRAVAQLQDELAKRPDDVEHWKLLGRSATVLGDYALARKAFGEAYTRTQGKDAEAIIGYAESMVLIDEREIDGEAAILFERALELAPDNPRALWYGGVAAYRRGDMKVAQQRWVELQQYQLPENLRREVVERLAGLEVSLGKPAPGAGPPAATGAIDITISIDPKLSTRVPARATLFVIARRGSGGPPLAVQRHSLGTWPLEVRISDADAMLPGIHLASGGPVTVIARISASGQPIAASGDLFGEVSYDFASAHPADVTINRIVP
jgi:cytochrome c-type biogenesis protein CcmH